MVSNCSEQQPQARPAGQEVSLQPMEEKMQAICEFSTIIACDVDMDKLVEMALEKLLSVFEAAEAGAFFLHKPGPDQLAVQCALGYDTDMVYRVSLRSGESIVGKVFQSGQAALCVRPEQVADAIADMTAENSALCQQAMHECKQPRSIVCVPLICADVKFGAVLLENWWGGKAFSESDLELAQALAALLALAVDRLRLARKASHSRQVSEEVSKSQQDVMMALSHDMRTPLASIKGYASALLLDDVHWDEQTAREYVEIIGEESDKLSEIIADLLETSMIDAGQLAIEREPTLVPRLARAVVEEMARGADRHRFLVSFPPDFPVLDADSGRIRRVLFNLVDNAVKYSPEGGLVVVRGQLGEDEVLISVADQGQGIPPEDLNRLFERFFRVKFVSGQHVVGSGLGLPIARNIVELHGGRIWAESKLREGTTMYFTLPRAGFSQGVETAED